MNLPSFQVHIGYNLSTSFSGCCHFKRRWTVQWNDFILSIKVRLLNAFIIIALLDIDYHFVSHYSVSISETSGASHTYQIFRANQSRTEEVIQSLLLMVSCDRQRQSMLALLKHIQLQVKSEGRCSNKKAAPTEHAPIQAETEREWTYCRSWPLRSFGSDHQ